MEASTLIADDYAGRAPYELIASQRAFLEKALHGSIKVLMDIVELLDPEAFGQSYKISRVCRQLAERLGMGSTWEMEVAGMLSQIGRVVLADPLLINEKRSIALTDGRWLLYSQHATIAHRLLSNIPCLEAIAQAMLYLRKNYDGSGLPSDEVKGNNIPLIARVVRVAADYVTLLGEGTIAAKAYELMVKEVYKYDPRIFGILAAIAVEPRRVVEIHIDELRGEAVHADDLRSNDETPMLADGEEIMAPIMERIRGIATASAARGPIPVCPSPTGRDNSHHHLPRDG